MSGEEITATPPLQGPRRIKLIVRGTSFSRPVQGLLYPGNDPKLAKVRPLDPIRFPAIP